MLDMTCPTYEKVLYFQNEDCIHPDVNCAAQRVASRQRRFFLRQQRGGCMLLPAGDAPGSHLLWQHADFRL